MSKFEKVRIWIATIFMGIFIFALSIVCIAGLWQSFNSFSESQRNFNKAYSEATAAIMNLQTEQNGTADSVVNNKDIAKISIEHLERLQVVQKNAVTNDLMSFLYSALTAVLIGLCAGFVVKSRKYSDEANTNAKKSELSAEKAEITATNAKKIAELAEKTVKEAKETADNINEKLNEMQKNVRLSMDSLDKINEVYDMQKSITFILSIHIEIIHARAELKIGNRIAANERFFNIFKMISSLPEKNDNKELKNIQKEILKLYTQIDEFVEVTDISNEERTSRKQATEIYRNYIDKSLKICKSKLEG